MPILTDKYLNLSGIIKEKKPLIREEKLLVEGHGKKKCVNKGHE